MAGPPIDASFVERVMRTNHFGSSPFSLQPARDWLSSRNNNFFHWDDSPSETPVGEVTEIKSAIDETEVVAKVYQKDSDLDVYTKLLNHSKTEIDAVTKSSILEALKKNIEENINIICGLEILVRGIPIIETKAQIKKLIEYLEFYEFATFKSNEDKFGFEACITRHIGLSVFGMILGPLLAVGDRLVIYGDVHISPIATFIIELASNAGVPDTHLSYVPAVNRVRTSYFEVERSEGIKINRFKTPMIIFEEADLDSACERLISAAWGHLGSLPESVGTVLIQESIFNVVVKKIKNVVDKLKIMSAIDKSAEICEPIDPSVLENLRKNIEKAKRLGIEIYQAEKSKNGFQPTLFIGGRVAPNDVLDDDTKLLEDTSGNSLTILSFRFIDEAVQLANNSPQGYGASVWSENVALCNEVAEKLNVGNVWINGHGESSAEVPIVPRKSSGYGYIGGEEGIWMYYRPHDSTNRPGLIDPTSSDIWNKTSKQSRKHQLKKFANYMYSNVNIYSNDLNRDWIKEVPKYVYNCLSRDNLCVPNIKSGYYNVTSIREPVGVITISKAGNKNKNLISSLVHAIVQGNTVYLIADGLDTPVYEELAKYLPKGALTIVKTNSQHNDSALVTHVSSETDTSILRQVTSIKNIWSNRQHNF